MNPISHGHTLIKVTEEYTLRPKKNDRCDVLIAAYEYLLNNFAYDEESYDDDDCGYSGTYVDAEDIKDLIAQLKRIKDE